MFEPLPDKPDHPALELEILELWEREGTFQKLREPLLLVDVHLDELHVALVGDAVEHRRDGVARAAPFRPEVDDDGLVALEHFLLEALFRDSSRHLVLS